jgi:hypothetical protein
MATTTNYGWTTPDDTALVKDGAAAIRTLGSSVDTTTKNLNPETTLGDIAYRSSTANVNTRLALGTAGQVLQVNSGATAPEWANPAAIGTDWTLLNSGGTALTGAQTITVSGISGKNKILMFVSGASSANASSFIDVRLNTDTGNNYQYYGYFITAAAAYASSNFEGESALESGITIARMGSSAASTVHGSILLDGCNTTGVKSFQSSGAMIGSFNGGRVAEYSGYYNSASTISSISLVSSTGNFDAGTIFVYTSA